MPAENYMYRDSDAASFYSTSTDPSTSPTNGYFHGATGHGGLPNIMYVDTEAANKGARPNAAASSSSPARYTEERTPLLETSLGQDVPPSYLEATTPMGWRGEGVGLLNEETATLTTLGEEEHKDGKYRRRSLREHCSRRRILKVTVAILAIIILAAIIATVAHRDNKSAVVTPTPSKPIKLKDDFPIRWPAACGKDYNVTTEEFIFGKTSELNVVEAIHQLDRPYKRVSGWIHITQAPTEQAPGTIEAKMLYAVSSSVDIDSIKYASSPNGLTIGDPSFRDGFDGMRRGNACMGLSVVLYMAAGVTLDNFNVRARHLSMQIHEGATLSVTNTTSITLTSGTLDASSVNSRETRLETISGSISGKYSLFDLLSVKTVSGSVNINVEPKEKAQDGPSTALFHADTMSGSIRVDTERKNIPKRDYVVSINTTAGSVDGTFIHGSKTEIGSVAGSINVDLLPYAPSADYSSILSTRTVDGQTAVELRAPYQHSGVPMGKLFSIHNSMSGQMDLTYPQEWEGHLEGQSVTGRIHLQGKDLELIRQDERPGFNRVEAKKGNGGSTMIFKTFNGGCNVLVGKK